jgi:hypothetical protein
MAKKEYASDLKLAFKRNCETDVPTSRARPEMDVPSQQTPFVLSDYGSLIRPVGNDYLLCELEKKFEYYQILRISTL